MQFNGKCNLMAKYLDCIPAKFFQSELNVTVMSTCSQDVTCNSEDGMKNTGHLINCELSCTPIQHNLHCWILTSLQDV